MRLNCVNILKMPDLAQFGPHPLGEPQEAFPAHQPRFGVKILTNRG